MKSEVKAAVFEAVESVCRVRGRLDPADRLDFEGEVRALLDESLDHFRPGRRVGRATEPTAIREAVAEDRLRAVAFVNLARDTLLVAGAAFERTPGKDELGRVLCGAAVLLRKIAAAIREGRQL